MLKRVSRGDRTGPPPEYRATDQLPPGWEKTETDAGQVFYVNHITYAMPDAVVGCSRGRTAFLFLAIGPRLRCCCVSRCIAFAVGHQNDVQDALMRVSSKETSWDKPPFEVQHPPKQ